MMSIKVKRKSITIQEDQAEFIDAVHLNLSCFVQDRLDEEIEKREEKLWAKSLRRFNVDWLILLE